MAQTMAMLQQKLEGTKNPLAEGVPELTRSIRKLAQFMENLAPNFQLSEDEAAEDDEMILSEVTSPELSSESDLL